MSLADLYRNAWQAKFGLGKGWLANWWPGTAIFVGQRGIVQGGQLQYQGHVGDYGVSFALDPASAPGGGPWDFSSSADTTVEIGADASKRGWEWLGKASAGLSASFGSQESLYLSAGGTTIERVANVDRLKDDLINTAVKQGMPLGQSAVVERQLTAQSMLIVSEGRSGVLKATVKGDVTVDAGAVGTVASLAGRLDVKKQTGGTSKQEYPSGMVLAYRVVTLGKSGWFYWRHITVRSVRGTSAPDLDYFDKILQPDDYFVKF